MFDFTEIFDRTCIFIHIGISYYLFKEEMNEIWLSPMTSLYITRNIQQPIDNTEKPSNTTITQGLCTDLGRSLRVRKAILLVWLYRLRVPNLPNNRKNHVIKRTWEKGEKKTKETIWFYISQ